MVVTGRRTTRRTGGITGGRTSRTKRSRKSGDDSRSFSLDQQGRPAKKWIEIMRPPAPRVGFKVPVWVPVDDLTHAERNEYLPESLLVVPEEESTAPEGQSAELTATASTPAAPAAPLAAGPISTPFMDYPMTDASTVFESSAPVTHPISRVEAPVPLIPHTPGQEANTAVFSEPTSTVTATPSAPTESVSEGTPSQEEPPAKRVKISVSPATALLQQGHEEQPPQPQP